MRPFTCCLMFCLLAVSAMPLMAETLSVVPLAEALENPVLQDTSTAGFDAALQQVSTRLLNQPAGETEIRQFRERVSAIALHRDTRVGKLFFTALKATPAIENLGEATFAAMEVSWPIALGGSIQVRVEYNLTAGKWLISVLEVTAHGLAAAPIAGMAPYFGIGTVRPELLDLEALDYLVGRDTADRELPEAERPAFDFAAALPPLFKAEADAFHSVLKALEAGVATGVEHEKRVAALRPHLADAAEVKAMEAADADPQARDAFWAEVRNQIAAALKSPRPVSVPAAAGASARVRWVTEGEDGRVEGELSALRLESGKIAPRGKPASVRK